MHFTIEKLKFYLILIMLLEKRVTNMGNISSTLNDSIEILNFIAYPFSNLNLCSLSAS